MRHLYLAALSAAILLSGSAHAATAQQQKMTTCNADAKTQALQGDARKAFMKTCLSADAKPMSSQQEKMKSCNADAGSKKLQGDERKAFMKGCLSGK